MTTRITRFLAAAVVALGVTAAAQAQDKPQLKTLGLLDVSVAKSLKTTADRTRQTDMLNRLTESLGEHLLVSFQNTRKFEVISRLGDEGILINDGLVARDAIRDRDGRQLGGRIKGLDNALVVSITDFADIQEGVQIEGLGQRISRRSVQTTAIFKIYDATTGTLMQAVRVPVIQDVKGIRRVARVAENNGAPDDAIVGAVAEELASRGAMQVLAVLFPVRVIAVRGGDLTINRGEGTEVAQGQAWDVFALGEMLKDPDTGKDLEREEVLVGEVVITSVRPKTSLARVVGENRGISTEAVLRPKPAAPAKGGRGTDPRDDRGPRDDRDDRRGER
jgi:hypothetical protein